MESDKTAPPLWLVCGTRSSSREVRIKVPTVFSFFLFSVVYFSNFPPKKVKGTPGSKSPAGLPGHLPHANVPPFGAEAVAVQRNWLHLSPAEVSREKQTPKLMLTSWAAGKINARLSSNSI